MGSFSNREIASFLWLCVFAVFVLRKREVRRSITNLLRAVFHLKILVPVALMFLYTFLTVVLMSVVGLWKIVLLKDTIYWFCFTAVSMMMRFAMSRRAENIFWLVMSDSLKAVILLEFLCNTYSFSLPVELILLPTLGIVVLLHDEAHRREDFISVERLTGGILTVVGLLLLTVLLARAISDLQTVSGWEVVRSIGLVPVLSLLATPFLSAVALYAKYELVFHRLNLGPEKDRNVTRYARLRIVMYSRLNLKRLQHLLTEHPADLMHIRTRADVDRLFG